ncbi:MAG: hypothetical protein AB3N23_09415 [Paracoccaceae bacterium]
MKTRQTLRLVCSVVLGASLLSACARPEERVLFDGYYFRSDAKPVDKKAGLKDFRVRVRKVSQSLDAARAAGQYEGTRYCIKNFGTSEIIWSVGPETEPAYLPIENDQLFFRGQCDPI